MAPKSLGLTKEFLQQVSNHLSSRAGCRQLEYEVTIGVVNDNQQLTVLMGPDTVERFVFINLNIMVYPNIHMRGEHNKMYLLDHIIVHHFKDDVFGGYDEFGNATIKPGSLIPGVYKYQFSFSRKRRRWVRVR